MRNPFQIIATRVDGWFNSMSGIGGPGDKTALNSFVSGGIVAGYYWAQLYDEDWLARKIVQLLPSEALRRGFTVTTEGVDGKGLIKQYNRLDTTIRNPDGCTRSGLFKGRLFGGAAIVIGLNTDPLTPAEPGTAGEVLWLDVARRDQLREVKKNDDANSPLFGETEIFEIVGTHPRRGLHIHASRLVLCEGLARENLLYLQVSDGYPFPWLSVLAPVKQQLGDFNISWRAVSTLLQESSIGVMKIKGLIDMLAEKDTADAEARLGLLSLTKSVAKTIFLDADDNEDFSRAEVSFNGIAAIIVQVMQMMAAAADGPTTLIFGTSPAGMNATGQSDLTQWYDRVASYQENSVEPKLERILSFIAGRPIEIEFPSPWEPTEQEAADVRLKTFQADKILYDMGAVEGLEVAVSRVKDATLGLDVDVADKEKALKQAAAAAEEARLNPPDPNALPPNAPPGTPPGKSPVKSPPPKAGA